MCLFTSFKKYNNHKTVFVQVLFFLFAPITRVESGFAGVCLCMCVCPLKAGFFFPCESPCLGCLELMERVKITMND